MLVVVVGVWGFVGSLCIHLNFMGFFSGGVVVFDLKFLTVVPKSILCFYLDLDNPQVVCGFSTGIAGKSVEILTTYCCCQQKTLP